MKKTVTMKGNKNISKKEVKGSIDIKWDNIIVTSAVLMVDGLCWMFIGNIYQKWTIVFASIIVGIIILSIENKKGKFKRIFSKAISFFGEKRIKDDGRSLLSPCLVEKNSPAYFSVKELLYVSKKEGSRNIALTGVYGSGKSSILKTFMSLLPKRAKVLQISLSNFLSIDAKEEDIEKKVFQHIIFKANQAETAQTEFDRKSVISRKKAYVHAIFLVFTILCVMKINTSSLILVSHIKNAIIDIFGEDFCNQVNEWWYVIFSAFVVVYAVYIIKHIIRRIPNLRLKYVGKEGLELKLEEKYVLDKMLEEIVYFLKAGKYDMVIFEDLDRIKDPRNLFLKLRELNLLINESDDYIKNNKTIRFIYAIRDDVYREELRTKIFDYIIPVIPIVDKFNAGDYLIHTYGKKDQLMSDIKKDDLKELGSYIDNMRTLKNVVNEYRLYQDAIGITTGKKKLLALTIYKNLFPSDYSLLHQKRGCLHAVTSNPDRTEIKQTCEDYLKKNCQLYNMTEEKIVEYADSVSTTIEDMLNKGYIPEDIYSFISCFRPNSMIKSDNDFCERVINGSKDEPSFELQEPWDVVVYLPEEAFKHDGILNYGIAKTIFSDYGTDNEKGRLFINTVMNNVQFIFDYLKFEKSNDADVIGNLKTMFESIDFSNALFRYIRNESESELQSNLIDLVTQASEQGIVNAQFILGYCHQYGDGVREDKAEAVKWYTKAAEQGLAQAQCNLGYCHDNGEGVAEDKAEAVEWYKKAAEQGLAQAQCNLGYCYDNGEGVAEDKAEAVKWYTKAAEQGLAQAQINLGNRYLKGDGVPEDKAEAVKWYTKAAEQGYAKAQFNLALCYYNGDGVPEDKAEAVKWYKKAAEQGYADAYNGLAWIYQEQGQYEEALPFINKALELSPDDANCIDTLAMIYQGLGRYDEAMEQFEKALKIAEEEKDEWLINDIQDHIQALKDQMEE